MQVGFIGLGTMGAGMAANLQKAGYQLIVHDIRRNLATPHLTAGARWADSPMSLAAQSTVIFTSLPGPPEVEAVALGPNGLVEGMQKGSAWFDLTTNSPTLVRRIHQICGERGLHLLDAPVSGGPQGAKSGRLAVWVGGEEAIFNAHRQLLGAFSDAPRYIGPIGAGSVAKLVHNCAGYAIQTALAEVFSMGVKAGVEPLALWEAVRTGASGRQRTFDRLHDRFLANKYDPPSFALALAHKDMRLATELGRELGVPMRLANLAFAEMTEALNRGWEHRDSRSPMLLQLERCGLKIEIDPQRIEEVLNRDPPLNPLPKRG
ncbi:MAG TPA: NAD(P)-dependent oxidoreductase [Hyphomicrobiaceae bacterium]|jgi:3-hydroxyisobutyrate dehydrogenase|nr:NAD(P)-dependent oxidoreductase [Hyphomicrobiaceae bacterium]